jgi:hypothetical protein
MIEPRSRSVLDTRFRGYDDFLWSGSVRHLLVVPANAWTHNHRTACWTKAVEQSLSTMGRGVWVPAFAGTTLSQVWYSTYNASNTAFAISAVPLRPPNSIGLIPSA